MIDIEKLNALHERCRSHQPPIEAPINIRKDGNADEVEHYVPFESIISLVEQIETEGITSKKVICAWNLFFNALDILVVLLLEDREHIEEEINAYNLYEDLLNSIKNSLSKRKARICNNHFSSEESAQRLRDFLKDECSKNGSIANTAKLIGINKDTLSKIIRNPSRMSESTYEALDRAYSGKTMFELEYGSESVELRFAELHFNRAIGSFKQRIESFPSGEAAYAYSNMAKFLEYYRADAVVSNLLLIIETCKQPVSLDEMLYLEEFGSDM